MEIKSQSKYTVTGLDENLEAVLCYAGFWVTGIIFYLLNKKNQIIRFHALQSIVAFGILFAIRALPVVGVSLSSFIWLIIFGLWLWLIVQAYQDEVYRVPFIGEWVWKHSRSI